MNKHVTSVLLLSVALMSGCSGRQSDDVWTLMGEAPAGGPEVILQATARDGGWYAADTVTPDARGRFSMTCPRRDGAIYRLIIGDNTYYVPADSTETVTLSIAPDGRSVLDGSESACLMSRADELVASAPSPTDSLLHRRLLELLDGNYGTTAAYYVLKMRTPDGLPLINPVTSRADLSLLRAVTNAYVTARPEDPRTALLLSELESVRRAASTSAGNAGEQAVIYAPEIGYFDFELMQADGSKARLSDTVGSHKAVLLSFVNTAADNLPAVHMALGEARDRYASAGLEIFEVGFARDQFQWASATRNLPWINVYQSDSAPQTHLGQYMISSLPVAFLIVDGDIVERIEDFSGLNDGIKKHIR